MVYLCELIPSLEEGLTFKQKMRRSVRGEITQIYPISSEGRRGYMFFVSISVYSLRPWEFTLLGAFAFNVFSSMYLSIIVSLCYIGTIPVIYGI
jgi:hypothetical protein